MSLMVESMESIENRLRIVKSPMSLRETDDARKAIRDGQDMLSREGEIRPPLRSVIWRLMQDAAKTEATFPDRERAWLAAHSKAAWPELNRPSEDNRITEWVIGLEEAASRRGELVPVKYADGSSGMILREPDRSYRPRFDLYKANHERTLVVLGWLRFMRARTFDRFLRDRGVVLSLARGVTVRHVRCLYFRRDAGDSTVTMVKHKMLRDIEEVLRPILTDLVSNGNKAVA